MVMTAVRRVIEFVQSEWGSHIAAIVAIALLIPALLGVNPARQTLAPMDLLLHFPGWENVKVETPLVHLERSDAIDHRLSHWRYFREELRDGRLPLWNPRHQLGAPGIQSPIYEGLTLPFLIYTIWPDEATGYTLAILFCMFTAAVGGYLLAFLFFGNRIGAVFAGLTFAFCGFNIAWMHWPHVVTVGYLPWALSGILLQWHRPGIAPALMTSISVALMGLGGFPFVAVLGVCVCLLMGGILLGVSVWKGDALTSLLWRCGGIVFAGVAGGLVALPFLLESLHILDKLDLSYRQAGSALRPQHLAYLFGGDFFNDIGVPRTYSSGAMAVLLATLGIATLVRKPDIHAWFAVVVLGFCLAVVFSFAPRSWIEWLPTFSYNSWTRGSFMIGLSLGLLSAYTVAQASKWANTQQTTARVWVTCIILVATGIQFTQLGYNTRSMNARPPLEAYFPDTLTLSQTTADLEPLQSVIADRNFLISGTVTNYRLPELFAHGFRFQSQAVLMEDIEPNFRRTPTSSMLDCDKWNLSSPTLDYAVIRYVLTSEQCGMIKTLHALEGDGQKPVRLSPDTPLKGVFNLNESLEKVEGATLLMATYHEPQGPGPVSFKLIRNGDIVGEGHATAAQIRDNQKTTFQFKSPVNLAAGSYSYEIAFLRSASKKPVAVWTFESSPSVPQNASAPKLGFVQMVPSLSKFKIEQLEPGIVRWENLAVQGSAYFIDSLNGHPALDFQPVDLLSYRPDRIELRYEGVASGFIVAPVRVNSDWRAKIDGKPTVLHLFKDVFPAVAANRPVTITLEYETSRFWGTIAILVFGAGIAFAVSMACTTLAVRCTR